MIPVFSSHYSYGATSLLTLEEAGKTAPGNPVSICDLAHEHHLKQVVLVDERIDGAIEAHKNLSKPFKPAPPKALADYVKDRQGTAKAASDEDRAKAQRDLDEAIAKHARESLWSTEPVQLIYGVKFVVVPDMAVKDDASLRAESKVVVFVKHRDSDTARNGYGDLVRLWNRAWTDGFYYQGRLDWKTLKELWTPNLALALPFFSSFVARNTLTFASIVPDLPVPAAEVTLFKEVESGLPFAGLLDEAADRYAAETGAATQRIKSVYYRGSEDFDAYTTFRAADNRGTFSAPNVSHLSSDRFSWADYLRLTT